MLPSRTSHVEVEAMIFPLTVAVALDIFGGGGDNYCSGFAGC